MKKINIPVLFISLFLILLITACKKTLTYKTDKLTDYMNLQPGKSITYRLDSTTFTFFGTIRTVTSYIVQDVIDTIIEDNLGRPTWRVFRYINDTALSQSWANLETYTITPTIQTTEVMENNLRYIKLSLPLNDGFSWQGNSYIAPTGDNNDPDPNYMIGWNYTYDSIGASYNTLAGAIPNTLIVRQDDEYQPDSTDIFSTSFRTYSVEVYAKGIGLVYKDFIHWFYEPPGSNGNAAGYKTGYGIRLNMLDHN